MGTTRQAGAEGESLGDADGQAHPGEGPRAATEGDRVESRRPMPASPSKSSIIGRMRSAWPRAISLARERTLIDEQRRRAILRGGVECQQLHGQRRSRSCAPLVARCGCGESEAAWRSRVTVIGGSAAENTLP